MPKSFRKLVDVMARLRSEGGCEWDRVQDHRSLRQYLLEEAHEVIDAIDAGNPEMLREELGDLLFQVIFHSRIAEEAGDFGIDDVLETVSEKMVRRHPHVFGNAVADSPEAVVRQWEKIKETVEGKGSGSKLDGIPRSFPSMLRASKLSTKASRAGFDWTEASQVLAKVREETAEVEEAMAEGDKEAVEREIGDLLFSIVNLGRFLDVNPEIALMGANDRFERRFREMEKIAASSGNDIGNSDFETLDRLWEAAKKATDTPSRGTPHDL